MLRRTSIILLEIFAALIAGVAILLGIAFWRLSGEEPLRMSFLTPYLEQALTPEDNRFSITIEDTVITWAGWERTLDLRARGVRAIAEDGQEMANVPEVALRLSVRALMRGVVAPTAIEAFGPHVHLRRDRNGRFAVAGVESPAGGAPISGGGIFAEIVEELQDEPEPNSATGYLEVFSLGSGRITLEDAKLGITWEAPEASVTIRRRPGGLVGEMSLSVTQLGRPARFAARLDYDRASDSIGIGGSFAGLDVRALGSIEPSLEALSGVDLQLHGNFTTRVGLDGRIAPTRFDMTGGPGQINMADQFDEPVPVQRISLSGRIDAGGDRLWIDSAVADLGGPQVAGRLSLSGLISGRTPKTGVLAVAGSLSTGNIDVAALGRYWPKEAGRDARSWVIENITAGVVHSARMEFELRVLGDAEAVAVDRLEGDFDASETVVHYLKPLPPIENAAGHASFTDKEFVVDFTQGGIGRIAVQGGKLRISGLDRMDQLIEVNGTAAGPLPDVLTLLDNPRLGYASKLGIDPAATAGSARADISFAFPAKKDVDFDHVKMTVKGEATDVALAGALFDQDVSAKTLTVDLNNAGMDVSGDAHLAGIPVALQWRENFDSDKAEFRSRFVLVGTAGADQRQALGLDMRPYVDGPISGEVVFTQFDAERARVDADLDLTATVVDIPEIVWRKEAGEAGNARLTLDLLNDTPVAIPNATVTAGTLAAEGSLQFTPEGDGIRSVRLGRLDFGRSRLRDVAATFTPTRPEITIGGGEIDAEPLLEREEEVSPTSDEADASDPLLLSAQHLDRVILGEGREIINVSALLDHDGEHWQRILVDGALKGGSAFALRYEPEANTGKLAFSMVAENAGEALRTIGVIDNVIGGRLTVTGEAVADEPRRPLRGRAEISEFRLVRAPVLARVLTLATLTGFVDVLTGEGLLFNRFTSDFTKTDGRLDVELARAHGPSIGLTATGTVDFDARTVDVEGTIAPAYLVNSLLGNIPLVGDLLQGGKGEGVFAATYQVRGALDEPQVTVNPLAALAPGFLRGLFDIFDGGGEPTQPRAIPEPGKNK